MIGPMGKRWSAAKIDITCLKGAIGQSAEGAVHIHVDGVIHYLNTTGRNRYIAKPIGSRKLFATIVCALLLHHDQNGREKDHVAPA